MKKLRLIILATAVLGLTVSCASHQEKRAKYIFLFIGDGMSVSHVSMTESYMSYQKGKLGGERLTFSTFPYFGMASTYSADRLIPCSASAGTAIACGVKTNNMWIGVDAEGNDAKSICYDLQEQGYKIGIISTAPVNHATPSAFYGSSTSRYSYREFIEKIPDTGFEFFAGAGFRAYYGADGNAEGADEFLERNGYEVCFGEEEYLSRPDSCSHIVLCQKDQKDRESYDYIVDGTIPEGNYSLTEMLERGMDFLGSEEPFFIMCEGGKIDWAAHANKTLPTIKLIQEFDQAVAAALKFYEAHPDETLIVVTSDHDTGGASMGLGKEWLDDRLDWKVLDSAWVACGNSNNLSDEENRRLNDAAFIGWTTMQHTGNDVPVYAIGKGAEKFAGKMDNTEIKGKILGE